MSTSASPNPVAHGAIADLVRSAARASARRPKLVIALWLALIVACAVGGGLAGTRSLSNADSGSGESGHAELTLQHAGLLNRFDETVIVRSASASQTAQAVAALTRAAARTRYVTSISSPANDHSLSRNGGRTALLEITFAGDPDQETDHVAGLEATVARVAHASPGVYLGEAGDGSFTRAENNTIATGMTHAELIAFPLTLLILVAAFATLVAAVVPLLLGLTSVGAAMGALGLVSQIVPEGSTTSSVVILIGLAVGVDYSLFYIRRERAERAAGRGPDGALDAAAATVGRAVLVAGATVVIGLAGLLFSSIRR